MSAHSEKVCLLNPLEGRCEFWGTLELLKEMGQQGQASSWCPDLLFPPQLLPTSSGLWTPAHKSQLSSPHTPQMATPWLPSGLLVLTSRVHSLPLGGQTQMGLETFYREVLGPRLCSRSSSTGSGWSCLFGPWGQTRTKIRPSKVQGPRPPTSLPPPDLSVVLASI